MALQPDFKDFLTALADEGVEYLVVGGYAVSFHSRPRFTKDLDVLVGSTPDNRARLATALKKFGAPDPLVDNAMNAGEDEILWFGSPPTRIDILFGIPGVSFTEAYRRRAQADWEGIPVHLISADDLLSAKNASGRDQDLLDIRAIQRAQRRKR